MKFTMRLLGFNVMGGTSNNICLHIRPTWIFPLCTITRGECTRRIAIILEMRTERAIYLTTNDTNREQDYNANTNRQGRRHACMHTAGLALHT